MPTRTKFVSITNLNGVLVALDMDGNLWARQLEGRVYKWLPFAES
jgi:hypothetical protein